MALAPVVRYMIVCNDWGLDPATARPVIRGLISTIRSPRTPPYPLVYPELCVFLQLTDSYGAGQSRIACVFEETGQTVFELPFPVPAANDPLDVTGVPVRIRGCQFPFPGLFQIQFWYEGRLVEVRPLRMR